MNLLIILELMIDMNKNKNKYFCKYKNLNLSLQTYIERLIKPGLTKCFIFHVLYINIHSVVNIICYLNNLFRLMDYVNISNLRKFNQETNDYNTILLSLTSGKLNFCLMVTDFSWAIMHTVTGMDYVFLDKVL